MLVIRNFTTVLFVFLVINNAQAQTNTEQKSSMPLFNTFDATNNNPGGKPHPDAAQELKQFDFMIGRFQCQDSLLINGEWKESLATWNSTYTLNGHAIEDQYRNDNYAGMSIRYYDQLKERWVVHFFGMPGNHQGVWYGRQEGDQMVMRQKRESKNGSTMESRLTFYDISEEAFKWKGESVNLSTGIGTVNWKIGAKRVP